MRTLVLLALAVTALPASAGAEHNPVRARTVSAAQAEPTRLIVKLRESAAPAGRAQLQSAEEPMPVLARRAGLALAGSRRIGGSLHVLQLEAGGAEPLARTLERLRADPAVEYAEPDRRRFPHAVPNDPLFANQWYMQGVQASAVDAVSAWDGGNGSTGVVIAVLDTGVRFDHPDLRRTAAGGRLLPGYDFISADVSGVFFTANDGDGRDPDPSDPGDWVTSGESGSSDYADCDSSDSSWHGTRVAGIIGALTHNATGIAGLTWNAWILPARVLGKCGGYDSDILAAMRWAAGLPVDGVPQNPYPARIINMSLGGSGACIAPYQTVVDELTGRGVLVVVSAGNEGGPVEAPANCRGVVAVAGLRHAGTKVGFSSLGPEVALGAPGGNCVNVGAGQPCLFSIDTTSNAGTASPGAHTYTDQIDINVGTSFAAPIVSGIAGLMLGVNGNLDARQLRARLQEGTRPFPVSPDPTVPMCRVPIGPGDNQTSECNCTTSTCGAGMANARGATQAARRPIAAVALPADISAGQNVTLQAAGSAAACDRAVSTYTWSVVGGGTAPVVSGPNGATATVVAPSSGTLTVRLVVTDDAGLQDTAEVVITPNAATTSAPAAAGSQACPTALDVGAPAPGPAPGPAPTPTPPPAPSPSASASSGGGGGALDALYLLALALAAGGSAGQAPLRLRRR